MKDTLAYRYAAAIMDGKDKFTFQKKKHICRVGDITRLTIQRFFNDLDEKRYELDSKAGYIPIQFIENFLHHWKGNKAGHKFELEAWQHFYFLNLFGWLNDKGDKRFIRSYLEVARKNGKTSMQGTVGVYHITTEQTAHCYVGATKEDQAIITVNDAGRIIQRSPQLKNMFEVREHHGQVRRVFNKNNLSFIAPLGRDSKTQDGLDISLGIIDEFHAHKDTGVIDVIESGMVARANPMLPIITTAGFEKVNPCYSVTRKAGIDVLNGVLDNDRYFYLIYTMDEEDDYEDPKQWVKANPNYGVSVIPEQLEANFETAKTEGGSKWVNFLTKNLNIWTDAPDVWIRDDIIRENNHGVTEDQLLGQDCYFGVDLGSTRDFTSITLLFPNVIPDKMVVKVVFFIPEKQVRDRADAHDFTKWVADGWIRTAGEEANDYRVQVDYLLECREKYNIIRGGYDAWAANSGFVVDILDRVSAYEFILPVPQSNAILAEPVRKLEAMLYSRQIDLMENPVIRWQFGNVVIAVDDKGNKRPSKKKSEQKIDGIFSTLNAMAIYLDDVADGDKGQLFAVI